MVAGIRTSDARRDVIIGDADCSPPNNWTGINVNIVERRRSFVLVSSVHIYHITRHSAVLSHGLPQVFSVVMQHRRFGYCRP